MTTTNYLYGYNKRHDSTNVELVSIEATTGKGRSIGFVFNENDAEMICAALNSGKKFTIEDPPNDSR